jgi:hypothetical protein
MFFTMVFFFLVFVLLFSGRRLLLVLLMLEVIGLVTIYFVSYGSSFLFSVELTVLLVFCVLVIEGVIGLRGLISLVSYSGGDYVGSSRAVK